MALSKNDANGALPNAEAIHTMFRGTGELSKIGFGSSFALDCGAASLATWSALSTPPGRVTWVPFIAVILAFFSALIRIHAGRLGDISQTFRRMSARAFASGVDLSALDASDAAVKCPAITRRIGRSVPAPTLLEYYDPKNAPGYSRLREIYAHSAFFTWVLLKNIGWISLLVSIGILVVTSAAMYSLLMEETPVSVVHSVSEIALSFVMIVIFLRVFIYSVTALLAAGEMATLANQLILASDGESSIERLTSDYDFARATSPHIPTVFYRILRKRIEKEWIHRREALHD